MQLDADAGTLHPSIELLPEIGELRQERARAAARDQPGHPGLGDRARVPDGHWTLELRAVLDVEQYNAEISLLTGMCAAAIMLDGGIGLLRTLPPPTDEQVGALRQSHRGAGDPVAGVGAAR